MTDSTSSMPSTISTQNGNTRDRAPDGLSMAVRLVCDEGIIVSTSAPLVPSHRGGKTARLRCDPCGRHVKVGRLTLCRARRPQYAGQCAPVGGIRTTPRQSTFPACLSFLPVASAYGCPYDEGMSESLRYAPGWPGIAPRWTSSAKTGLGTSLCPTSCVWFTLSHGILNEVYYPRVDQACLRDLGLIVTDGHTAPPRNARPSACPLVRG